MKPEEFFNIFPQDGLPGNAPGGANDAPAAPQLVPATSNEPQPEQQQQQPQAISKQPTNLQDQFLSLQSSPSDKSPTHSAPQSRKQKQKQKLNASQPVHQSKPQQQQQQQRQTSQVESPRHNQQQPRHFQYPHNHNQQPSNYVGPYNQQPAWHQPSYVEPPPNAIPVTPTYLMGGNNNPPDRNGFYRVPHLSMSPVPYMPHAMPHAMPPAFAPFGQGFQSMPNVNQNLVHSFESLMPGLASMQQYQQLYPSTTAQHQQISPTTMNTNGTHRTPNKGPLRAYPPQLNNNGANMQVMQHNLQAMFDQITLEDGAPTNQTKAAAAAKPQKEITKNGAADKLNYEPRLVKMINDDKVLVVMRTLCRSLNDPKLPVEKYLEEFDYEQLNILFTLILDFFSHIEKRLAIKGVTYLNLIDATFYSHHDFLSNQPDKFLKFLDFWHVLEVDYHRLAKQYFKIMPKPIVGFRAFLVDNTEKLKTRAVKSEELVDLAMVTYKKLDCGNLQSKCAKLLNADSKMECFLDAYCIKQESDHNLQRFIKVINTLIQNSCLAEYGPRLHPFGSLSNGLGTYDSDIDLFIEFSKLHEAQIGIDFETGVLALRFIDQLIEKYVNMRGRKSHVIYSRRCPILKLTFREMFNHLAMKMTKEERAGICFNKCDISLTQMHGVTNSRILSFLTTFDYRFKQMAMLLKFWAKQNEIICQDGLSTYAFTMLVIYYLQTRSPSVLPTFDFLKRVSSERSNQGGQAKLVGLWDFECCTDIALVGTSENREPVEKLIVGFFKFYKKFDFYHYAIRPRYGKHQLKALMVKDKSAFQFNANSYICIEDPYVLDHNVGLNFRTRLIIKFLGFIDKLADTINQQNCVDLLLKPTKLPDRFYQPALFPPIRMFSHKLVQTANGAFDFNGDATSENVSPKVEPSWGIARLEDIAEQMQNFTYTILCHLVNKHFKLALMQDISVVKKDKAIIVYASLPWLMWLEERVLRRVGTVRDYSQRKAECFQSLKAWLYSMSKWRYCNPTPGLRPPLHKLFAINFATDAGGVHQNSWYHMNASTQYGNSGANEMFFDFLQHIFFSIDRATQFESFHKLMEVFLKY